MYNQNTKNKFNGRLFKIHAVCDHAASDTAHFVVMSNMFILRRYSEQVIVPRTVSIIKNVFCSHYGRLYTVYSLSLSRTRANREDYTDYITTV